MDLLDLFFPRRCVVCGKVGSPICDNCFGQLKPTDQKCPMCCQRSVGGLTHFRCLTPLGLDGLTAIWSYRQPQVRQIIKGFKYHFNQELVSRLFEKLTLPPKLSTDFIVPLPLHYRRQNWRGFNQAELIASHLSKFWDIPLLSALSKTRSTKQLTALKNSKDRKTEIKGAFNTLPENKKILLNKKIILVDDVFTSGSTMKEAAKVLKRSGAKHVYGFTLAN